MDIDILEFGAKELKTLCTSETVPVDKVGDMTTERWSTMIAQLIECEIIAIDQISLDGAGAFTTEFLNPPKPAASEATSDEDEEETPAAE